MAICDSYFDWGTKGKYRPKQHITGETGITVLRNLFPNSWAIREYSPDYGIDLDVELFEECDNDMFRTKGEHVLFQVKSTEKTIKKTIPLYSCMNVEKEYKQNKEEKIMMEVVQYQIETDLLATVERMGTAVPVLLCVVDIVQKEAYFVCLNDYIEKILLSKKNIYDQKTVQISIPIYNKVGTEFGNHIIEWYGKRAKLYAFFNKVNYQNIELDYCDNDVLEERVSHFLKVLLRLDAWSAADYFPALLFMREEIDYYLENGITKDAEDIIETMIKRGEEADSEEWEGTYCIGTVSFREIQKVQSIHRLWKRLSDLSNIFEENAKEAYLPSYFAVITSYFMFYDSI